MTATALALKHLRLRFDEANRHEYRSAEDFEAFLATYPEYEATLQLSRLRSDEFPNLLTYLDWTGAAKAPRCLFAAHKERLDNGDYGNPHSESPDSRRATAELEHARQAVLAYFNGLPEQYAVIFTCNATAAMRLVGESYPFGQQRGYVYLRDNHNSALGIREYARRRGAPVKVAGLLRGNLRLDGVHLEGCLNMAPRGLFVYPAQSNFSGVQHPLDWIKRAERMGWDVLLDAAAFVPTNRLDLRAHQPQFVTLSFYKMFGYPTGLGCLIVRRDALGKLERPWFAGGTVEASSSIGGWHVPAPDVAAFEDGTVDFLGVPAVITGLDYLAMVGTGQIHDRCRALTGWLLDQLQMLHHTNGQPLIQLYGPGDTHERGPTIAFNFLDTEGQVVDERIVARKAGQRDISLRTGCFCNPGCGEVAFGLDDNQLIRLANPELASTLTLEGRLRFLGLPSGGAIRASLGSVSTFADVERFLAFVRRFLNTIPDSCGLPPRNQC